MKISIVKTVDQIEDAVTALDLREAIAAHLGQGGEPVMVQTGRSIGPDGIEVEPIITYAYFLGTGRGAVCAGGGSEWTDCQSLADLQERWKAGQMVS